MSLEGCGTCGAMNFTFLTCLLWQDRDGVVEGLFLCFQPVSAGQQAVGGLCPECHTLCNAHSQQFPEPEIVEQSEK